jgi:protein O-GlcNAc transferase
VTAPTERELFDQARTAEAENRHDDAVAAYGELVATFPSVAAHSTHGLYLARRGQHAEALVAFRASLAIEPTYADHYNAGNMLHALGDYAAALAEFDRSIALRADYAEAHVNRGIALFALGRLDDARASFDRGIATDPALVNAHRCQAILLEKLGDRDAAIGARTRVAELAPSAQTFIELASTLRQGLGPTVYWEPDGVEEQIVTAVERALALGGAPQQRAWAMAERVMRLQRIAHGRQASQRAGLPIDPASAIARYREAAAEAVAERPDDDWFADKLADATSLTG